MNRTYPQLNPHHSRFEPCGLIILNWLLDSIQGRMGVCVLFKNLFYLSITLGSAIGVCVCGGVWGCVGCLRLRFFSFDLCYYSFYIYATSKFFFVLVRQILFGWIFFRNCLPREITTAIVILIFSTKYFVCLLLFSSFSFRVL